MPIKTSDVASSAAFGVAYFATNISTMPKLNYVLVLYRTYLYVRTNEGAVLVELGGVGVLVLCHAVALAVPRQRLLLLQARPWRRRLARAHRRRVTETQHEQHAW